MLRIRLQRYGRKNRPNYRVVVAEHSAPIQGRYIDLVGSFDPLIEKHGLKVDVAKVEEWIKKGAKPTNTVARLLKGQGAKGMEPFIFEMKDRAVKHPKDIPEGGAAPTSEATSGSSDAGGEESVAPAAEDAPPAEAPAESAPAPAGEAAPAEEGKEEEKEEEAPAEEEPEKEEEKSAEEEPEEESAEEKETGDTKEEEKKEESA